MADLLVQDLDDRILRRLLDCASRNGRSLQGEVKRILDEGSRMDKLTARRVADEIRRRTAGRQRTDSTDLIRELRDR